jgi:CheY-like chemotaxis protein
MRRTPSETTVLIVEDEPLIRMLAVDMIESSGYKVIECGNATVALQILGNRNDIHIVFTDIDMPNGMNGILLASEIRNLWPSIHLVITSGRHIEKDVILPPDSMFISKPYWVEDVVAAIKKLVFNRDELVT